MPTHLNRRQFLASTAAVSALGGLASLLPRGTRPAFAAAPTRLVVERRTLEVLGRPASVFGIRQPDGTHGLVLEPGQRFLVDLENRAGEETSIHWHGQSPPFPQDGVGMPYRSPITAGAVERYDFESRPGTHWMHSHHGLQEQLLLAAPLVVRSVEDARADIQEVVVLLHDFTFKEPAEVLAGLTGGAGHASASAHGDHGGGGGQSLTHNMHTMHGIGHDLNDVEYDAYLANDRTLDDPEVVPVERGGRVRLRLINGATTSAFHIDLGTLEGTVVAVDGGGVEPVRGTRFPMTMGQRLDILVDLPSDGGAFPVLAQREGDRNRTGIILATPGATVSRIARVAEQKLGAVGFAFEEGLRALQPLAERPVDRTLQVTLAGSMAPYAWTLASDSGDGHGGMVGVHEPMAPGLSIRKGERVAIRMHNMSSMAHPMHLHGHTFQVIGYNGRRYAGAVRDTVLVPIMGTVEVVFDADNPGRWPFHCHNLLHMATGMTTEIVYEGSA